MNRIDHTSHAHPATPAGRKACRKATRAQAVQDSKLGKAPQEWSEEAKAATAWVDAFPATEPAWYGSPLPLPKPITINFVLKTGKTCRVIFDQYQNPSLFITAADKSWSRERTVNQAISEAIHGVFQAYGVGSVEDYRVTS